MPDSVIVLGLDVGYAKLGYGLVEKKDTGHLVALDYGLITTTSDLSFEKRLLSIYNDLLYYIQKTKPCAIAYEKPYVPGNGKISLVNQAMGVILMTIAQTGYSDACYGPSTIKKQITGDGKADKPKVQKVVEDLLGVKLNIKSTEDDAADAVAIAICHLIQKYNYDPLEIAA